MTRAATDSFADILRGFSVELVPGDARLIDAAVDRLELGTLVSLTWIPGSNPSQTITAATKLGRAGLVAMPHIGARHLESKRQLEDIAERLAYDAKVDRVLIIGGDRVRPAGPFDSSLAVMKTGIFQRVGISRVAVAGFPEGNPHITSRVSDQALADKVNFAKQDGLELSIVTQFCFSAAPILAWLRRLRAHGIETPVRIGLAGPAGLVTLARYAVRCGVGNSLHVLTQNPSFAKALVDKGPEPIIRDIADSLSENPRGHIGVAGLHFYMFGGLSKGLDWIEARSRKLTPAHTFVVRQPLA